MIWILVIVGGISIQTDWISGPGVLGPVTDWGKAFYQSDSITYNVQGQISPIAAGTVDYTAWTKHLIDTDGTIMNHSIVAADFDGDDNMDFAGWKGLSNTLQFYKNNGSNVFSKSNSYAGPETGPYTYGWGGFIATDYIAGSALPDVVVPVCDDYWLYGGLSWFQNNGSFNFTSHSISSIPCFSAATGDIDNSGNISIVAGCYYSTSYPFGVKIYKNTGGGSFTLTQTLLYSAWRVRLDDMNNDGHKDILLGNPFDGLIYVFLNNGNGTFPTTPSATLSAAGVDGLWSRDMDNDGYEDIICGSQGPTSFNVYWLHNNGNGINYTQHTVYSQNNENYGDGAYTEDLDMDGKADISSSYFYLAWFRQIGPDNFTEYQIDSYVAGGDTTPSHWVIPFKLNRGTCMKSGEVDLLVCYQGNFAWYENNMLGQFAPTSNLESSILNSQCSDIANWAYFGYDVCTPTSTALSFQFRTGNTSGDVTSAAWSTPVFVPAGTLRDSISIAGLTPNKLFQYRVNCVSSTDAPVVYEVWVTYDCGSSGTEEKHFFPSANLQVQGNEIYYSLPQKANISISLYDIKGSIAKTYENREQEAGTYRVTVSGLKSGIYFVVFSDNGVKTTRKMVLIK